MDLYCMEYQEYTRDRLQEYGYWDPGGMYQRRPGCEPALGFPPVIGRKFQVCWGENHLQFKNAVAVFSRTSGGFAKLWDSILNSGFLDRKNREPGDFTGMLRGYSGADNGWREYGVTVTPNNLHPRMEVMNAALWLIASMEKGVPQTYDRFDDVRDEVVGRIQSGEMKFYVYDPGQFPLDPIKQSVCTPMATPFAITPPTPVPGVCDAARCVQAQNVLRMWGQMQFNIPTLDPNAIHGAHHGPTLDSRGVHLCSVTVDILAAIYDWFLGYAATHALAAEDPSIMPQWADHRAAQNICLRMALSAAATLAKNLLHETAHNLDLWHCARNDAHKAGCVQDAIAWTWVAYVTARLGLPMSLKFTGFDFYEVNWMTTYGLNTTDRAGNSLSGRVILASAIECQQGSMLSQTADTVWDVANVIVLVTSALSGQISGVLASVVSILVNKAVTSDLGNQISASIQFGVDFPLVMGGHVTACVITGRGGCADQPSTECWQSDSPERFEHCLNRPGGVIDPTSEGVYHVS
ncbi:MAG TPA: hypothetical protein PLA94_04470 [Myxococcota bacterium]|nr:hypothetical protein [Myxococcota bacterium]